jgi:hypothetical protein
MPIDLQSYSTKSIDPYKLLTDLRRIVDQSNRLEVQLRTAETQIHTVQTVIQTAPTDGGGGTVISGGGGSAPGPIGPFPALIVATDGALLGVGTASDPLAVSVDNNTIQINGSNQLEVNVSAILPTFTPGSVIFAGAAGELSQDNANFFWDDTNNRLGIGTTAPSTSIHTTGGLRVEALTTPRIPYASTGGLLADNASFTWDDSNTRLFVPTIVGGTGATSDLVLQSTSGVGTTASEILMKVGNNGSITAVEVQPDAGGNFGTMGIGTLGNLTVDSPLCVFGTGADIGYLIKARSANGNPSAYIQMQTGANANAQAGFSFYQRQNGYEWRMAVVGNDGNNMRFQAGTGGTDVVLYITQRGNVGINDTNPEPSTGTKGLYFGDGTAPATMASNTAGLYANDVSGTVNLFAINEAGESNQLSGDIIIASGKYFYTQAAAFMLRGLTAWTDGAGVAAGTLTNAPSAGDPTKWIPVDDNGVTRYIPAW